MSEKELEDAKKRITYLEGILKNISAKGKSTVVFSNAFEVEKALKECINLANKGLSVSYLTEIFKK